MREPWPVLPTSVWLGLVQTLAVNLPDLRMDPAQLTQIIRLLRRMGDTTDFLKSSRGDVTLTEYSRQGARRGQLLHSPSR